MTLLDKIVEKCSELLAVAEKYGASNVRIFGSVVRGEETEDSDIDFLIAMEPGRSLVDLCGLEQDFSRILDRKADIVTENSLNPLLRDKILVEARSLTGRCRLIDEP